ncbi:hypothetical protein JET14_12100 [Martelella lutilitoris]|uniref:Uncharacterized protein n=1 Tax=Martelella lutilitoris TaxID=2583532 RepID=A0A7T7HH38_9HYPH|nr:hypothetical protein [Martelella lutilitoris]QQM29079.1 hypothetical protein JET14_12100 [Martelella lutilitoris]
MNDLNALEKVIVDAADLIRSTGVQSLRADGVLFAGVNDNLGGIVNEALKTWLRQQVPEGCHDSLIDAEAGKIALSLLGAKANGLPAKVSELMFDWMTYTLQPVLCVEVARAIASGREVSSVHARPAPNS